MPVGYTNICCVLVLVDQHRVQVDQHSYAHQHQTSTKPAPIRAEIILLYIVFFSRTTWTTIETNFSFFIPAGNFYILFYGSSQFHFLHAKADSRLVLLPSRKK